MTTLSFPRKRESSPGSLDSVLRVKDGMTDTVKLLLRHAASNLSQKS
jgi:hypothetical protein